MKKTGKVFLIVAAITFGAASLLNVSLSRSDTATGNSQTVVLLTKEAQAVCQEFGYGGGYTCCFMGGSGCVNGLTDEKRGPYYYY